MTKKIFRLQGGHRNDVFKTNGFVKIIWKDGFSRREQIREGVLLENFVATHTDIKARMLVDKSKPTQEENGKLVTYFYYVGGEIRYPWNLDEIASAARLLIRLHSSMNAATRHASLATRQLHLDFARGNVLFQPGSGDAIGVIDFETTGVALVEQELGRTLSFLLVDTPLSLGPYPLALAQRSDALLTNYELPYKREAVLKWTEKYLQNEDYGTLNPARDEAMHFLLSTIL